MDEPKQKATEMLERLGRMATTREAAEFLGLSVRRVQQLCRRGWMGRRVGRQWLIGDELRDFIGYDRPPGRPKKTRIMPPPPPTPEELAEIREQLHSRRIVAAPTGTESEGLASSATPAPHTNARNLPNDGPPEPRLPQFGQVDEEVWI